VEWRERNVCAEVCDGTNCIVIDMYNIHVSSLPIKASVKQLLVKAVNTDAKLFFL
jgi:hypothetical protein